MPFFLHHRPSGASDAESEARKVRLITMESLYSRFFGTDPLGSATRKRHAESDPENQPTCKNIIEKDNQSPKRITIQVVYNDELVLYSLREIKSFRNLLDIIHKRWSGSKGLQFRTVCAGGRIASVDTPMELGIEDDDTLYAYLPQLGC